MDFRTARVADAAALAAMNWLLIRDEGHRNRMSVTELEVRMAEWLAGEYKAVLLEERQQPIGYALFRSEPEYVYLRQFFVQSEYRRRGIGRAGIQWLHEHAWRNGRVRVEVLASNARGIAFWRAVGFDNYCLTLEMEAGATGAKAVSALTKGSVDTPQK